mmetsp:Transcript_3391/g.4177  ORF Transcript_3391/g.4177 Transcript_3391/m.4177 type:complete len:719 (+) Transcript_3391:1294-3450(+)
MFGSASLKLSKAQRAFRAFRNVGCNISRYICKQSKSFSYRMPIAFGVGISIPMISEYNKSKKLLKSINACGIMAMAGEEPVVDYLIEGLTVLQNRGYDSAGIASVSMDIDNDKSNLSVTKYASVTSTSDSLAKVKDEAPTTHKRSKIGIAHTRWATHGAKTDVNAHPHIDYRDEIAIVHNGTIENCFEIKDELQKKGVIFKSQTDTEVIANLISWYLNEQELNNTNETIEVAFEKALSRLDGSWGIAMLYKERPNEIFAARRGSPMMIGIDSENRRNFVASEHTAFSRYTNAFISLDDGEMAVVSNDKVTILEEEDILNRIEQTPSREFLQLTPDPYPHWTLKEIYEGPQAVLRALGNGGRMRSDDTVKLGGLDDNKNKLLPIKNLIITGCGTSLNAGLYGKKLMNYLNSFNTVQCIDSAEVTENTMPYTYGINNNGTNGFGCLAITQSGETKDVVEALKLCDELSIQKFSIVNVVGSLIARMTNLGVYLQAGREYGVASTKAFLNQVTVLSLISVWFAQNREYLISNAAIQPRIESIIKSLQKLSIYCGITLNDTRDICKEIAKEIYNKPDMFVLGKGFAEPIAYEGALKIKEITYCHCEGYSGGALKHGPFALIEEGTPVCMIILDDEHGKIMKTNAQEITSRGGKLIIITDNKNMFKNTEYYYSNEHHIIEIPKNGVLTALLAVVPLQLIAYEMAVLKGINPDKPKNLAKAVTVV